jgi:DNA-binding transcriptional LysR family regulator
VRRLVVVAAFKASMNFRQLEMFRAVAENGGYAKAAESLHVAHSAIHRQIRILSDELHDPLLYRQGGKTCLTPAGRICLDLAMRTAGEISKATRYVRELSKARAGSLRIGTGPTLLCFFVLPILRRFIKMFPDVEPYVMTAPTDVLLDRLGNDQLDLGILTTPLDPAKSNALLVSESIYRDEYMLAFSKRHLLARKRLITPSSLRGLRFILPPRDTPLRAMLDQVLLSADVVPKPIMELDNEEATRLMVQTNMGVAFLPALRPPGGGVTYRRFPVKPVYRDVVAVRPRSEYVLPCVREFERLSREYGSGPGVWRAKVAHVHERGID